MNTNDYTAPLFPHPTPRWDDLDQRPIWGEPEYREALAYIGHHLGLSGSFHLVTDVLAAFDTMMSTKPERMARVLVDIPRVQRISAQISDKAKVLTVSLSRLKRHLSEIEKTTTTNEDVSET